MRIAILITVLIFTSGCNYEDTQLSDEPTFIMLSNTSVTTAGKSLDKNVNRNQILNPNKLVTGEVVTGGGCTISSVQQDLLDAHNQARSVARNCGTTFYAATTPLNWDCTLAQIADDHNQDMANNNFFSHTGSDGLQSSDRATNAGYIWSTIGENIAAGQQSVESVMQGWLESPGHCANIMRPQYKELGADLHNAFGSSQYPTYWTAAFGTKRNF